MTNKQIRNTLNDGFLTYGTTEAVRSKNSSSRKQIGEQFVSLGRLAYEELSCRDEDHEMAKINSAVLSMKLRTLCPPNLQKFKRTKLQVVLDEMLYEVIKVDSDRDKRYLYFYLQEVGAYEPDNG